MLWMIVLCQKMYIDHSSNTTFNTCDSFIYLLSGQLIVLLLISFFAAELASTCIVHSTVCIIFGLFINISSELIIQRIKEGVIKPFMWAYYSQKMYTDMFVVIGQMISTLTKSKPEPQRVGDSA